VPPPDQAEHAAGVLETVLCVCVSLAVIVAMVGSLHPDEKCRADAQKVLDRLLWHGQGGQEDESWRDSQRCLSAPLV
jgi:hypothetical protein